MTATILKPCKFKSFVPLGTHTLLDKSSRVLQLPTYLSQLSVKGYKVILDYNH